LAETGRVDRSRAALERLRAPRPQADMADPALRRLGELERVAEVVAPSAEEDGAALARLLLHPEDVDEEAQALLGLRRKELRVRDASDLVHRLRHGSALDERAQSVEVVREGALL